MKATSIEQIREHLARGGRVTREGFEVVEVMEGTRVLHIKHQWRKAEFNVGFAPRIWELLPIEEEPKPVPRPARVKPRTDEEWTELAKQKIPSAEQLRKMAKDNPPPQEWYDEEEPLPGTDAKTLPSVTEDPTGESRSRIESFSGRTPMGVVDELRRKLMFGQPWSMDEQREVWELLTGERIEWGRRCEKCECTGSITQICKSGPHQISAMTVPCSCDRGYTVRPTWMGEVGK